MYGTMYIYKGLDAHSSTGTTARLKVELETSKFCSLYLFTCEDRELEAM